MLTPPKPTLPLEDAAGASTVQVATSSERKHQAGAFALESVDEPGIRETAAVFIDGGRFGIDWHWAIDFPGWPYDSARFPWSQRLLLLRSLMQ